MRWMVGYQWHLPSRLAEYGISPTQLCPLLSERGIRLSASQTYRLAATTPERLSLAVLAALCDILRATPNGLITVAARPAPTPEPVTFAGARGQVPLRPAPARITTSADAPGLDGVRWTGPR
jgi:DNA-binding Xre family transcriptional regulator